MLGQTNTLPVKGTFSVSCHVITTKTCIIRIMLTNKI